MTEWYYSDAQRTQHGPVTAGDLATMHTKGLLPPETLVWREGMSDWKPWRDMIREVIAGGAPDDPRAEALVKAAEAAPDDGAYRPYAIAEPSPYTPPTARVDDSNLIVAGGRVVHAGFWKRFAAYFIDYFVATAITYAVLIPVGMIIAIGAGSATAAANNSFSNGVGMGLGVVMIVLGYLAAILLPLLYFAWMHSSASQATLGKMAVGIKVVRGDGTRISFWRAVGRIFATLLSTLILFIGYIMAGFTERKQALHDMVCDTLVVDKWAYTEHPEWQREELGTVTVIILVLAGLLVFGFIGLFAMMGAMMGGGLR